MGRYPREEILGAFEEYKRARDEASRSGDWSVWARLFTEDAHYVEHAYGEIDGRAAIEKWMATYPDRESVLEAVQQAGIACAPVVSLVDALRGEIAEERDLLVPVDDRRGGTRPVIAPAARLSETENRVRGRAPERGEHNDAVLREVLGYGDDRIAALRDAGVLREETQSATPEAAR